MKTRLHCHQLSRLFVQRAEARALTRGRFVCACGGKALGQSVSGAGARHGVWRCAPAWWEQRGAQVVHGGACVGLRACVRAYACVCVRMSVRVCAHARVLVRVVGWIACVWGVCVGVRVWV